MRTEKIYGKLVIIADILVGLAHTQTYTLTFLTLENVYLLRDVCQ